MIDKTCLHLFPLRQKAGSLLGREVVNLEATGAVNAVLEVRFSLLPRFVLLQGEIVFSSEARAEAGGPMAAVDLENHNGCDDQDHNDGDGDDEGGAGVIDC